MKVLVRIAAWLGASLVWTSAARAASWVDTHVVADDVRIELERSGAATFEHAITMQIKGGPLRSFDLPLADADISPEGGSVIPAQTEGGLPIPLAITPRPDGGLHVSVESPRGVSRGMFVFHVRYKKSLLVGDGFTGGIRRDGALLRVGWTGPAWQEGLDNAKCTFVVPSAPTEPRPPGVGVKGEDEDDEAGIFITQVRRSIDRDEVELIRPHVARGEAVRWSARIDPRALGEINDPRFRRAPSIASGAPAIPPEKRAAYAAAAGALLIGFSLLVFLKAREVRRTTKGAAEPRALVPIGTSARVLLSGPVLVGGVAMQIGLDDPLWGTLVVLVAMSLGWYLPPAIRRTPRGPGRWLPLSDGEAFAPAGRARTWLDARTKRGLALFVVSLCAVAGLAYLASRVSAYDAYLVVFDGAILFPLFGTGSARDLPGHPISGPGPALGRIARALRARKGLRAIAWARLPEGSEDFDELRLLCASKVPLRGFIGIELGLVGTAGAGGFIRLPEILVRVVDASPCHEALLRLLPGSRWIRGRRADERVTSLRPRLPTTAMTIALVARLVEHTRDTSPPRAKLPGSPPVARAPARKRAPVTGPALASPA